ncbi:MAG TPA: hypothetical protein PLS49_04295 [Candidatus Woesebacteria bacterium]|mgnify:CR=1 FL=1|nr:hypothetical protein [Candidatus Woesebacteria bacterium]
MTTMLSVFLILTIPCLYFYLKFNKRIEDTIPITVFLVILVIYIAGLFNVLILGIYINIIIAIVLLGLSLIELKKNLKKIKEIITPALLIWISIFIISYLFYEGRMLVEWDEFTHWGDVVKMMYNENIFNTNPLSISVAKTYPPALSIFQYFFQIINRVYEEYYLFIAYQIFSYSLFLPFIKKIKWGETYRLILVFLIMLFSPIIVFNNFYGSIYVDALLGMVFAYVLATIFISKKYDKFTLIKVGLSLFVLTLLKDIGAFFSFICFGVITYDLFINKKNFLNFKSINKNKIKQFAKNMYPSGLVLCIIICTYLSWKLNIILNVDIVNNENIVGVKSIINAILNVENSYLNRVVLNYIGTFSNIDVIGKYTIIEFSSILLLVLILVHKKEKDKDKSRSIITLLYLGEILYAVVLLLLYMRMFSEYEATNLASFERYFGIYLNAILFFAIYLILYKNEENTKIGIRLLLLFIFVLTTSNASSFVNSIYNNKINIQNTITMRQPYIESANRIVNKIGESSKRKIYVVAQNSSGLEKWILRYELRNILKGYNDNHAWSIGEKYNDKDVWTVNYSKSEFEDILYNNYDYIYFYNVDQKFIEQYGEIFHNRDIKNDQLYKIDREKNQIYSV